MVAHTLRINRSRLHGEGMDLARKKVTRVVRQTFNRSQVQVPVDTGLLRASARMNVGERGSVVVGEVVYSANYAAAVHEGRRALTIRPTRPGGRLRFVVDGRVVWATKVHQPARAGRPYLSTALAEVAPAEGFRVTIG